MGGADSTDSEEALSSLLTLVPFVLYMKLHISFPYRTVFRQLRVCK